MSIHVIVFDLDDTLVNTKRLEPLRRKRDWNAAINAVDQTTVFPGVTQLLSRLNELHISVAVVTTSISNYATAVLRHHGITPDVLVAYHDVRRTKPAPDGVLIALKKLSIRPQEAVGVGDLAKDCLAYRAAGVVALGAGWSPDIEAAEWDEILPEPHAIIPHIDR